MAITRPFHSILFILLFFQAANAKETVISATKHTDTIFIKLGFTNEAITEDWKNAVSHRISKQKLDSIAGLQNHLTNEEQAWLNLIDSKRARWNLFRDSLKKVFRNCAVPDTIYLLLGLHEGNDAFTYQYNTVCFDLEALQRVYGSALLPDNNERIDRLYAHEFTHLLHKDWARKNKLQLQSFKDSILWECIYEGLGMYRSLSKKWFSQNGILPEMTKSTLAQLYPIFVDMLTKVETSSSLPETDKNRIVANLSNGPVAKKWGAFTVAIWLSLEANGDDKKLVYWTEKGINSIIPLARKYLTGDSKTRFESVFK